MYEYHVRAGHVSPERIYGLYRRINGENTKVTIREVIEHFKSCHCYKPNAPSRSKNFIPTYPSVNSQLFLDFKSINTTNAPVHNCTSKLTRLSIIEPLSGACWSFKIEKCTGRKLVEIMRIVLTIHGKVKTLRPDNGKTFIEGEFKKWCDSMGIEIKPTAVYNPQANRAERHHRQINRMLDQSYSTGATIEDDIFDFCQAHNLLRNRATGLAPIEILKGHLPR